MLSISRYTLKLWRERKLHPLPHMRFGRSYRYQRGRILAWIEEEHQLANAT